MSNPFPPPPPPSQSPFPLPPPQKPGMSGCVAVGMWWWSNNGEQVQAGMAEGEEAGRNQDEQGCVALAKARKGSAMDITGMIRNGLFVRGCLNAARETPGFCNAVPASGGSTSTTWPISQCPKGDQSCVVTMQTVQEYCSNERPQRGFGTGPAAAPAPATDSAGAAGTVTDTAAGTF